MRVAVLDDYQDVVRRLDAFGLLDGHDVTVFTTAVGPERLAGVEALVLIRERTRVDEVFLDRVPSLRLIAQTGRLGPHVDAEAARARGIVVVDGGGSPVAPAELTWALVLAATRRLPQYVERLRAGEWQRNGLEGGPGALGHVLAGRTLGVVGLGRIGALVAGYGRAFGMDVRVWGREGSLARAAAAGYGAATSQRDLFARADVLSAHLPLRPETRGTITLDDLRAMRPSSLFVNTSRAALVEPGALATALAEGRPGFAAVDVFDEEPATADPLVRLPNVVAAPHIGFVERDSYESYLGAAFAHVVAFASGRLGA
ncbi:MAG: D-2-hydroxyacid dehydrogenase family protein [Pseudomonadota bacterium]